MDNFIACTQAFNWDHKTLKQLCANAINDALMTNERKAQLLRKLQSL